jgi:hypothetical protein
MSDEEFLQEAQALIQQVVEAETTNFLELAKIVGLDLLTDFAEADLRGTFLSGANVTYPHTQSKIRVWASPPRLPGFAFYSEANAQPHFFN